MGKLTWMEFFALTLLLTIVLFGVSRTLFLLYVGLTYLLILYLLRNSVSLREPKLDFQTILGLAMVVLSPVFLFIRLGEYPSPSTFHALFVLGLQLIFFSIKGLEVPTLVLIGEVVMALLARTNLVGELIDKTSSIFIKITSALVKTLVVISRMPIEVHDNVAVIRNSMVIIGAGCSGLDAFVIYILATVLLIYIRKSSWKEALLLLLGALGIIPLNAIRIFTLLVIGYHSGISYLKLFHSHLGDLMFILYVYIYWWIVLKKAKKTEVRTTSQPSGGET